MNNYNIAVASYSFHGLHEKGECDVFHYLDLLKFRYRVNYADIWSGYIPTTDDSFILKLRSALDRHELTLANLCIDGPHLWEDDSDKRAANKAQMFDYIEAAKKLGAKSIRIDFGGSEGHTMSDEAFEYIVNTYHEYCSVCGEYGIKIGPENHWGWDRVPEYLEKVKNAVNSPAYGHLFHFGNFYDEHEKGEDLCVSYAMHTHVHAGSMPYAKRIFTKLNKSGYTGVLSVEHHSAVLECERTEWQLATVRGMIAELTNGIEGDDYFSGIYSAI